MGKEIKIGLSILGVLLLIFGVLLFRRMTAADVASHPGLEPLHGAELARDGLTRETKPEPEEAAAEVAPLPGRYANQVVPTGAVEAIDDEASQTASSNPFRKLNAQEPVETDQPAAHAISEDLDEPLLSTEAALEHDAEAPGTSPALLGIRTEEERAPAAADREAMSEHSAAPTQWQSNSSKERSFAREAPPVRDTAPARDEPLVRDQVATSIENGPYTVLPNDSLWSISEKAYGTGGYFKALGEYNRAHLPRLDRLTVGNTLTVPPASTLEQNFPSLCPKQRKSAVVKPCSQQVSAQPRRANGGNVYVVEEGDTLFDIARYELGKASRWTEIYDLNRDVLGEDFDYLQPGIELALPAKNRETDSLTRQRDARYQR